MEKRRASKRGDQVPLLEDKNSDFNGWYSRLMLKLDANGLWEDFCQKEEPVPSKEEESTQ
ncbi:hypothetical protein GN244_ATG09369 [Phytophthora infestans]|uniref:DUF4219 domain-containing protein n=1 Tax=Phytophthora infestans TaxID=4787 RepID=A0A833WJW6_PHYIN|nr:hypothetical protein GN244_ATG09369 [Phytophthora infestans]KAF4135664.1 hypothetical protein GN958_ATG15143 [Phytophthora infestans]KAF4138675.1 hypothetical protein GN958_ATG12111 [Phytophthora infestans]